MGTIHVFDQNHIITVFVVYQLINKMTGHQNSVSSRPHIFRFPVAYVSEGIIERIRDRRVPEFPQRETFTRIFDSTGDGAIRMHVGDLNKLLAAEVSAMFYGIKQHFPECTANIPSLIFRNLARYFRHEIRQPVCRFKVASGE